MDYSIRPKFHFKPKKGWINDPNGLVYFKGYYHIFYQHLPNFEHPWKEPVCWGHARTKDFLTFEELPLALIPDEEYDKGGCWSGTAIVKDDVLYVFYASISHPEGLPRRIESVSVAYSTDGIHFEKYANNPVIPGFPEDGGPDFRDPAVMAANGKFYLIMATGHPESKSARLLLYESEDLLHWEYNGIASQWENCIYAECPSFMQTGEQFLLTASVCPSEAERHFYLQFGDFEDGFFSPHTIGEVDQGPDQYAGQVFRDHKGRCILITWIPGWPYSNWAEKDVGCLSVPREITLRDGKIYGYPIEEVWNLMSDTDPAVIRTEKGFIIERTRRDPVIYEGEVTDLKIIRDEHVLEVFVNGGEKIYTVLL